MRNRVVRRLTVLLAILVLVSALAFALIVRDEPGRPALSPPPAAEGPTLFESRCTPCHTAEQLGSQLKEGGAARAVWEKFLLNHGNADDREDRLILDYLAALE